MAALLVERPEQPYVRAVPLSGAAAAAVRVVGSVTMTTHRHHLLAAHRIVLPLAAAVLRVLVRGRVPLVQLASVLASAARAAAGAVLTLQVQPVLVVPVALLVALVVVVVVA